MKSIIMHSIPKGARLRDFERIAKRLGLKYVPGHFNSFCVGRDNCLYTKYDHITGAEQASPLSYISFLALAVEFNDALPRTEWKYGHPPCVGEWNASLYANAKSKRWFDGKHWSNAYLDTDTDEVKMASRTQISSAHSSKIQWRGLAEQPITAGFAK